MLVWLGLGVDSHGLVPIVGDISVLVGCLGVFFELTGYVV
jgi:hypothetical protein